MRDRESERTRELERQRELERKWASSTSGISGGSGGVLFGDGHRKGEKKFSVFCTYPWCCSATWLTPFQLSRVLCSLQVCMHVCMYARVYLFAQCMHEH